MEKTIWISYDLAIKGDYNGLFAWLDTHDAKECGQGLAFFKYKSESKEDLLGKLTNDLKNNVNFSQNDRIYVIYFDDTTKKNKGVFIVGNRKKSPWQGYGQAAVNGNVAEDY